MGVLSCCASLPKQLFLDETLSDCVNEVAYPTSSLLPLSTPRDQLSSGACDVVTGFHVEDWERHVLVLEGLAEGGVGRVWAEQPHHHTQG